MSKKFWNELITEYFDRADSGALREELDSWHKHDIYYGTTNVKNALLHAYTTSKVADYDYKRTHSKTWTKAANAFIKAAKKVYKSSNRSTVKAPWQEGFVATILPQKSTRSKATSDMRITQTNPYKKAQDSGWAAAQVVLAKEFSTLKMGGTKGARAAKRMDFLHADDPSRGKMGKTGKSTSAKDYFVPGKGEIGSRVTTVGTYATGKMQDDPQFKRDLAGGKRSEGYVPGTEPVEEGGDGTKIRMKSWRGDMNPTIMNMFSDRASAKIFEYIEADLGWKATRSKSGQGRSLKYVVEGSVGPRAKQENRYPWDMPIRQGEYARMGIQGRLNEILEDVMQDMFNDVSSAPGVAAQIEASDTIGEIMESDLAGALLDTMKKEFKSSKNVKVKITRTTKKVKDNRKTAARLKLKGKGGGRTKPRIKRSKAPKPTPKTTKSGSPDMRFKENKEAWGGRGAHSPIGLIQLLNKALPDELKENMTGVYPKSLEYRTGRFAESARVTNIVPFPNLTQISYTYQKNPYQVFEPGSGSPLASAGRDPQQIIGGTIRQIAQSIMGTKFGLVRTKRV